jgi:16S rRNA (guanine(527)-N(7))-methyltransferase RsmG
MTKRGRRWLREHADLLGDAEAGPGARFRELLVESLLGVAELNSEQLEALERHCALLWRWNRRLNLTSVRVVEKLATEHYCESVLLASLLPPGELSVADIGSGAGFPGLVVGVVRPEVRVALIESDLRKAVFLREAARAMPNLRVIGSRAEAVKERFDWIVARAVRWKAVIALVPRLAPAVGLLVGERDAAEIVAQDRISWARPVRIPWRRAAVVLLGRWAEPEKCST